VDFPNLANGSNWTESAELGHTFMPSRDVDSTGDFPRRSDFDSERHGCAGGVDESDS